MRVQRRQQDGSIAFELLDDHDRPIAEVDGFLRHLGARACSPNTLCAYAHDLLHFYQFLERTGLNVDAFGPPESLALLEYLRRVPSRRPTGRLYLVLTTTGGTVISHTMMSPWRSLLASSRVRTTLAVPCTMPGDAATPLMT